MMKDMPHNGSSSSLLNPIQLMGLVSSLKTGDPTIDMILALLLPYVVSRLVSDLDRWIKKLLKEKKPKDPKLVERRIVYDASENSGTVFNTYLIRGIYRYLHVHCRLELDVAELSLTTLDQTCAPNARGAADHRHHHRNNNGRRQGNTTADLLDLTEITERPVAGQWLDVGRFGTGTENAAVSLMIQDSARQKNKDNEQQDNNNNNSVVRSRVGRTIEVHLKSRSKEAIADFVETVHTTYKKELEEQETNDRYMFELQSCPHPSSGGLLMFQEFKLGDSKTFANLFSRQSRQLLSIVDQFQNKQGKYAIPGYPYKLGLLLSGPPGTGKTSLIKALSHHTQRHVVSVPLHRVTTNAGFMKVFFNQTYNDANGVNILSQASFSDVIFVLEDIDVCTNVVFKRDALDTPASKKTKATKTKARGGAGTNEPGKSAVSKVFGLHHEDELNLSGILQVLDGVVETPGRIVIMTTNRPNLLDPALIRPGRVDRCIHMGCMELEDILSMLHHYFPGHVISAEEKDRLVATLEQGGEVTPARVEQLVSEAETIGEFLDKLKAHLLVDNGEPVQDLSLPVQSSDNSSSDRSTGTDSTDLSDDRF